MRRLAARAEPSHRRGQRRWTEAHCVEVLGGEKLHPGPYAAWTFWALARVPALATNPRVLHDVVGELCVSLPVFRLLLALAPAACAQPTMQGLSPAVNALLTAVEYYDARTARLLWLRGARPDVGVWAHASRTLWHPPKNRATAYRICVWLSSGGPPSHRLLTRGSPAAAREYQAFIETDCVVGARFVAARAGLAGF